MARAQGWGSTKAFFLLVIVIALLQHAFKNIVGEIRFHKQITTTIPCGPQDGARRIYDTPLGRFCIEEETRDMIKTHIKSHVPWEPHVIAVFERYVKAGDVVLDVGAHIGTHTIRLAKMVGPKGEVVAFEPQTKIFQELLVNLDLNQIQNVRAEYAALGDRHGRVSMSWAKDTNESSTTIGTGGNRVELRTLDSYRFERVSLIKIDVEGFERQVLEGGRATILKHKPLIVLEVLGADNPRKMREGNPRRVFKLLADLGYSVKRIRDVDFLARSAF